MMCSRIQIHLFPHKIWDYFEWFRQMNLRTTYFFF